MLVVACCDTADHASTTRYHSKEPLITQKIVTCRSCGAIQEGAVIDWDEQQEKLDSGEWRSEEIPNSGGWTTIVKAADKR